jgi:CHAD domain-containing protein
MNIYKASWTGESRDIHRARLDAKRLFAIFDLLAIVVQEEFSEKKARQLFLPVYRQAGVLRELQVNRMLMAQYDEHQDRFPEFHNWLERREKKAVQKLIHRVAEIDQSEIVKLEEEVSHICEHSSLFNLTAKSKRYYKKKFSAIRKQMMGEPGEESLHKIRQNLKSVSTIATLISALKPGAEVDRLVSALNKTEMMIGDWHDQVVLRTCIEDFITLHGETINEKESSGLRNVIGEISLKSENLVHHYLPEVSKIVEEEII